MHLLTRYSAVKQKISLFTLLTFSKHNMLINNYLYKTMLNSMVITNLIIIIQFFI